MEQTFCMKNRNWGHHIWHVMAEEAILHSEQRHLSQRLVYFHFFFLLSPTVVTRYSDIDTDTTLRSNHLAVEVENISIHTSLKLQN